MEHYENILKFLDLAERKLKETASIKRGLEDKEIYYKEARRVSETRRQLRAMYYVYEDYLKTRKYIAPEIKKASSNITTITSYELQY